MFYNIKIKFSDSEYSLESSDKNIVEREMDAYFAHFFNASDEFKSQIKPVELNNESLVSIHDIDKQEENDDEVQYYESSDNFSNSNEINELTIENHQDLEISNENIENENNEQASLEELSSGLNVQNEYPEDSKLDFKLFLAGFIISDIYNQFLACAFYIKNVLKENGFNMKTINSHLIKATGNLADSSILNDFIERGFVDSFEEEGNRKYAISKAGEDYFINTYLE